MVNNVYIKLGDKMSEVKNEEIIKIEDYEQYWQKGGTYVLPVEVFNELLYDIERLQQKNKELKKYCCKRNDCAGRLKENNKLTDGEILTKLEKWLEERESSAKINPVISGTIKGVLDKLQELKEGKK